MDNNSLININGNGVPTLDILILMTIVMLLPSILIMMTSFSRILIIISFTRNAMGIQQTPPNMVLVGISLFLTLFIMRPVISEINETAYQPYVEGQMTQDQALDAASVPMKEFMLSQTEIDTLNMFMDFAGMETPENVQENVQDIPMTVVIPSFMTSELTRGFMAGFLIFIPFLLIDVVVASVLMSMGMIMLPPATISLPFKLLLFVTVNGWELLFSSIVQSATY